MLMAQVLGNRIVRRAVAGIAALLFLGVSGRSLDTSKSLGDHYLLLVSYMRMATMNSDRLTLFDRSPYDGVAVAFSGPYDAGTPISAQEITKQIVAAKQSTKKDLWPWVYLNRMIGRDPGFNTTYGRDPYFFKIHGADLENTTGAQDDFVAAMHCGAAKAHFFGKGRDRGSG